MSLRAMVYRDPDSSDYLAHCLELDLMASGRTEVEAWRHLVDVVREQIRDALANDNLAHLFHPAPGDAWRRYAEILQHRFSRTTAKIDLEGEDRNFDPHLDLAIAS